MAPFDPVAFYEAAYAPLGDDHRDDTFRRWRDVGARSKAAHAARLMRDVDLSPKSIVEIGCGEGALLAQLSRWAAPETEIVGYELSSNAARRAESRNLAAVTVRTYDGSRVPVADDAYDVAILSHVLEHVIDPHELLAEAARIAKWVIVEVPLEDNLSAARSGKRQEAARIGHLQFFDRAAVRDLCSSAGLVVLKEMTDPLPYNHHAFFAAGFRDRAAAAIKTVVRRAAWGLTSTVAERLFTVHYACIARAPDHGRRRVASNG